MSTPGMDRPYTLLIAALGGEGGGLLTDWIVEGATRAGLLVQSTSIPGVAQRTGATTYYLEVMRPIGDGEPEPLFALYPAPGFVDMAVATELVEAGRLVENGFVTPERTTLVASTHRVFSMSEKTAMGDGAAPAPKIVDAARSFAHVPVLRDFAAAALASRSAINALLLGALSAQDGFPVAPRDLEEAIRARGVAVDANLRGFAAGRSLASSEDGAKMTAPAERRSRQAGPEVEDFPEGVRDVVQSGIERLTDYQDEAYARLYLERLAALRDALAPDSLRETARYLALWMAYEDVMRVADLKSRASRHARIRRETGAGANEPVRVTEFFKPGVDEFSTLLPGALARRLRDWGERTGRRDSLHLAVHVRSDTVLGHLILRCVAALARRRRRTQRFAEEQAMIARWLDALSAAAPHSAELAHEIALCARIIKGYGDTRRRADANFRAILETIVAPALAGSIDAQAAAAWLGEARAAALADEEGKALRAVLDKGAEENRPKPVHTGMEHAVEAAE